MCRVPVTINARELGNRFAIWVAELKLEHGNKMGDDDTRLEFSEAHPNYIAPLAIGQFADNISKKQPNLRHGCLANPQPMYARGCFLSSARSGR
jgi:hypothetical protein